MSAHDVTMSDLLMVDDFAETASEFGNYEAFNFEGSVQMVADAIHSLHGERRVSGAFTFGFESDVEGVIQGATIGVYLPDTVGLYLTRWLELKRLTDDREATGVAQAEAIRSALMDAYNEARTVAVTAGLIA